MSWLIYVMCLKKFIYHREYLDNKGYQSYENNLAIIMLTLLKIVMRL